MCLKAPLWPLKLQILVLMESLISVLAVLCQFFRRFVGSINLHLSFTGPFCFLFFLLNCYSLCLEKTPNGCVCTLVLFVTRSLSSLKVFNLLFPVYSPSSFSLLLVLSPLCFNAQVQQRGEKLCFVLGGRRSGKKRGVGRPLCVNLLACGRVMSVKGIKTYHQTNLSITPTTVLQSLLRYLPPLTFPLMCLLSEK